LIDLCGPQFDNHNLDGASYPTVEPDSPPPGYAAAYGIITEKASAGKVMQCFSPGNLRVVTALAKEFAVCDHWYSSMAGPTEPNRMFVHAATCGEFDDSPSMWEQTGAELIGGISFDNGTIFDRLKKANLPYRIYAGDSFPNVAELKGVSLYRDISDFDEFADDINDGYDAVYTFIEPNYDAVELSNQFYEGNSQHAPGSVAAGEKLIKVLYETLRASPLWNSSILVIVWDEHGGFFDHVPPPRAAPTGKRGRRHGYMFDQYGPRVPAIVISPLVPGHIIEHRALEHSVIPATLEQLFGMDPLTVRDAGIIGLQTLATLKTPRTDAPMRVPDPVTAPGPDLLGGDVKKIDPNTPLTDVRDEWLAARLRISAKANIEFAPDQSEQIKARVASLKSVDDAQAYISEISSMIGAKRKERTRQRSSPR
jgi:phospholipase C